MTHYTTNGTAFLSTTTPFHSCATDLAFPVFRCASHPQMCNVDTVRSTEVGLIESRTSRASTGMQTPTGQLQSTWVNTEDARARFPSLLNTGASPRATEEDAFCRVRHSTLTCNRVSRPADMPSPMSTHGSAPLPTPMNLFWQSPYCKCGHTSRSQDIHPQHQRSAEQRSPSLELGPIDLRFHRPGAIAGQPQPFASVQRHGWPRHAAVAAEIRCAASGSPT